MHPGRQVLNPGPLWPRGHQAQATSHPGCSRSRRKPKQAAAVPTVDVQGTQGPHPQGCRCVEEAQNEVTVVPASAVAQQLYGLRDGVELGWCRGWERPENICGKPRRPRPLCSVPLAGCPLEMEGPRGGFTPLSVPSPQGSTHSPCPGLAGSTRSGVSAGPPSPLPWSAACSLSWGSCGPGRRQLCLSLSLSSVVPVKPDSQPGGSEVWEPRCPPCASQLHGGFKWQLSPCLAGTSL